MSRFQNFKQNQFKGNCQLNKYINCQSDGQQILLSGQTYSYNDLFKSLSGEFDRETKVWKLPFDKLPFVLQRVKKEEENKKINWKKACHKFNLDFVKKEDPNYQNVLNEYKSLMILESL